MEDMKRRKRCCSGDNSWTRKYPERVKRGEDCVFSILTENQAIMLKELYDLHPSISSISKFTGIHRKRISDIINGNTWRHLDEDC